MKSTRALVALLAIPAALSLAACGGGSSSVSNITGQSASIRFVNASPDAGSVDLYYVPTGQTRGTTATIVGASYTAISDFAAEPLTAGQVFIYPTGTSTTPLAISCNVPQLANNAKYTVVISGQKAKNTAQCTLFQDFDYTANGQVRVHHASPAAAAAGLSTVAFGFYTPPFSAATPLAVAGTATFPGFATSGGTPQATFASTGVVNVSSTTSPIGVAVGANPASSTATFTGIVNVDASKFTTPGSSAQANATGTIPGGGYNNGSVFAIDCGTNTSTPQGTVCASGVALIGTFDSK